LTVLFILKERMPTICPDEEDGPRRVKKVIH
jgi:hypothetical protein